MAAAVTAPPRSAGQRLPGVARSDRVERDARRLDRIRLAGRDGTEAALAGGERGIELREQIRGGQPRDHVDVLAVTQVRGAAPHRAETFDHPLVFADVRVEP